MVTRCPRNENGTCHAVLSSRPRSVMPMTPRSRNSTRPGTGNLFRSTSIRMLSCDQISPSSSRAVKPSRRRRSAACGVLSVTNDSPYEPVPPTTRMPEQIVVGPLARTVAGRVTGPPKATGHMGSRRNISPQPRSKASDQTVGTHRSPARRTGHRLSILR
jgi:hypothetical protein